MRNKKSLLYSAILAGLFSAGSAQAIVDIESLRLDESLLGLSGSTTAKFSGKSGNTDNNTLDGALGLQYVKDQTVDLFVTSVEYTESKGVATDKNYFGHFRHTHKLSTQWAWEAFTQIESSPLNNKYMRQLLGAGGRYSHSQDKASGNMGAGVMMEKTSSQVDSGLKETNNVVRINLYAKEKYAFNDKTSVVFGLYVQPNSQDFGDTVSIASMAYSNKMTDALAMVMDVSYKYDSKPDTGFKPTDWQYKIGINYRFQE